jgi:hypothetical protein
LLNAKELPVTDLDTIVVITTESHKTDDCCIDFTPCWAAQYNTWLLIKLTPEGVVFSSFLF